MAVHLGLEVLFLNSLVLGLGFWSDGAEAFSSLLLWLVGSCFFLGGGCRWPKYLGA